MTLDGYKAELRKEEKEREKLRRVKEEGKQTAAELPVLVVVASPLPASLNRLVSLKMKENAIIDDYEFVKTRK